MSTPNQAAPATSTTATTTTHEAAPAAASAPPNEGAGAAPTDWTTSFADPDKGYVQNKGWRNPVDMLESYRAYEKLHGVPETQILRLPKEEDQAGWDKVHARLGRPEKPEGYKLGAAEGADPKFAGWAEAAFHKAGLSTKQAGAVVEQYNQFVKNSQEAQVQARDQKGQQETAALQKEWGAAYEQNLKIANKAAAEFGLDEAGLDALGDSLGYDKAIKFLHSVGKNLGESEFVSGGGNAFGVMTPAAAKARIEDLKKDSEFGKKWLSGDVAAKNEMERLHRYAFPEYNS